MTRRLTHLLASLVAALVQLLRAILATDERLATLKNAVYLRLPL